MISNAKFLIEAIMIICRELLSHVYTFGSYILKCLRAIGTMNSDRERDPGEQCSQMVGDV